MTYYDNRNHFSCNKCSDASVSWTELILSFYSKHVKTQTLLLNILTFFLWVKDLVKAKYIRQDLRNFRLSFAETRVVLSKIQMLKSKKQETWKCKSCIKLPCFTQEQTKSTVSVFWRLRLHKKSLFTWYKIYKREKKCLNYYFNSKMIIKCG